MSPDAVMCPAGPLMVTVPSPNLVVPPIICGAVPLLALILPGMWTFVASFVELPSVQVDGFVSAMGIGTPTNITSNVNIPSNINALQFTNNTGDLTVPAGIDYTINTGATTSTPFLLDAVGGGALHGWFFKNKWKY